MAEVQRDHSRARGVIDVVELDGVRCAVAAETAEQHGARTFDALHLVAAQRVAAPGPFVTFDVRQANAARRLGFTALGA